MRGTIRSMRTQGQVNQRGEKHTARRGNNRQTRRLRVPEFAVGHLALDFEPDIEEENRHHRQCRSADPTQLPIVIAKGKCQK